MGFIFLPPCRMLSFHPHTVHTTFSTCLCEHVCFNSHMLAVAVGDLVSDGVLIRQILIVQEMLPALSLVEISNLSWKGRKRFNIYLEKKGDEEIKYPECKGNRNQYKRKNIQVVVTPFLYCYSLHLCVLMRLLAVVTGYSY